MKVWPRLHNLILAAFLPLMMAAGPVFGQTDKLDGLFDKLKTADAREAARIEQEIWIEWSKSGSPAMDLLLQRGRDAMAAGDNQTAIEHFTAIIDHSPDFAEAWNARATAYYMAGEFGPSVADIAKVLTLNPRHFGALSGLAMILEETGKPERALEVYKAALAIHPHLQGATEAVPGRGVRRDEPTRFPPLAVAAAPICIHDARAEAVVGLPHEGFGVARCDRGGHRDIPEQLTVGDQVRGPAALGEQGVRKFELDLYWDNDLGQFRVHHLNYLDQETHCVTLLLAVEIPLSPTRSPPLKAATSRSFKKMLASLSRR